MWDTIIISPFTNVLLFIYTLVSHNFGIAIILFTCLIRLITHPLMVQQIKGAKAMQDLQKDKRYIEMQKKYKNDKEKFAQEQMKLYQELHISPFSSCLPMLIQFPIMIGLYQSVILALASTPIQLLNLTRHVYPGLLKVADVIPLNSHFLWMNLGTPDIINLPFLSFVIPVPILAIVVVITTYLQSKMMTPTSSGSAGDQSAMIGNMMNIYMPFFMGWIAYTLASGLALYFVASNLIGIGQYALLGQLNWRNIIPGKKTIQKSKA